MIKCLSALILFFSISLSAFADVHTPALSFDSNNIYVRVPILHEMLSRRMGEMTEITVELMTEKVAEMLESGEMPYKVTAENLDLVLESAKDLEVFLDAAEAFNNQDVGAYENKGLSGVLPTAFMIGVTAKASLSVGAGAGVSGTVGMVFMPQREYVIPRRLKKDLSTIELSRMSDSQILGLIGDSVEERLTVSWALVVWPNVDVAVGAAAGASARVGGALIWGPMKKASDFRGVALGLSGDLSLVWGLNLKGGIMHNSDLPGYAQIKYLMMGYQVGAEASGTVRANVSLVFSEDEIVRAVLNSGGDLSGDRAIEEYKKRVEEKRQARPIRDF